MNILVTGGAGYIGSAAVKELINKGHNVIVVDNLSKGFRDLVDSKAKFFQVDLTDKKRLDSVFQNKIDQVMHFAAYKAVEESMKNLEKYSENIIGTINLLDAMVKHKVNKIIFSSTAAVYGIPVYTPMDENHPLNPISYYGFTKLKCENIIDWYSRIHGISHVFLRYFNVAGDAGLNYVDPAANNIFPIIMEVLSGKRDKLTIFGRDYDTRDGTCIRDYIDINDLINAHMLSLDVKENVILNLGTSEGISVKELVDHTIAVTGKKFNYTYGTRRLGDAPTVLTLNQRAKEILGWSPKKEVREMINSTYKAYTASLLPTK